jgi:transposase InsO family protein
MVDTSGYHVGAALHQRNSVAAAWQPLGFYSKKLDSAQRWYSAFDRELLACSSGIQHFWHMLYGRPFAMYTDHKPMTFALSRATDAWTPRQGRHQSYVTEFTADIRYIPGKENVVADTLSRPPGASHTAGLESCSHTTGPDSSSHTAGPDSCSHTAEPDSSPSTAGLDSWYEGRAAGLNSLASTAAIAAIPPASSAQVDLAAMAAAQPWCSETMLLQRTTSLNIIPQRIAGVLLLCDISQGRPRPAVPACHRRQVFAAIHEVAHTGVRATRCLIARRFAWTKDCQQCQRGKVTAQPAAAVEPIPVPTRWFSHIHVDLVGPMPTSAAGHSYIFTAVDRPSRWLEAIPLRDMSAASCGWVSRFGVPTLITSDRGTQFTSAIWEALCSKLGVKHITTAAYHPQSNGMVERAHRQLKEAMKNRLAGAAWPDHLPWVLLGLRAASKDGSNISSAELVYGAPLVLPGEFLDAAEPPAAEFLEHMRTIPTSIPTRPLSGPRSSSYRPAGSTCGVAGRRRRSRRRMLAHTRCWSPGRRPSSSGSGTGRTGCQWTG